MEKLSTKERALLESLLQREIESRMFNKVNDLELDCYELIEVIDVSDLHDNLDRVRICHGEVSIIEEVNLGDYIRYHVAHAEEKPVTTFEHECDEANLKAIHAYLDERDEESGHYAPRVCVAPYGSVTWATWD